MLTATLVVALCLACAALAAAARRVLDGSPAAERGAARLYRLITGR